MTVEAVETPAVEPETQSPSGLLGSDAPTPSASDNGDWRTSLPEELRSNPKLQSYKSPADIAKAYVNLNKLAQSKGVTAPADDASPEEWGAYWTAQGRPESPDKYNFEPSPNTHLDDQTIEQYRAIAFKSGMSERQFQSAMQEIEGSLASSFEEQQNFELAQRAQSEETLKKDWGEDWKANANIAWDTAKKFGVLDKLVESGLGSDADVARAFYLIGKDLGEDVLPGATTHNSKSLEDQIKDTRKKILELNTKNKGPSKDSESLNNHLQQLYRQLHGGS